MCCYLKGILNAFKKRVTHVKNLSMLICCVLRQTFLFLRPPSSPFGVDQPLGKNVKPIQMIKTAVSCLLCQVPVVFYKGPWPKSPAPESTPSFRACSAENSQVQSAQHDYQNREICFAWDAAKRRTPFKIILYFWVMQCCYVWNRRRQFWRPTKPLHKKKKRQERQGLRNAIHGAIYEMWLWTGYMVCAWGMIALSLRSFCFLLN